MWKNIAIVFLLAVTIFSIFKFVSTLKEKYALQEALGQAKAQVADLEKQKQKLLQDIEKEKALTEKLSADKAAIKDNLKASLRRMGKLRKDFSNAQGALKEMESRIGLLKAENSALQTEKEKIVQENDTFKARTHSAAELKGALQELRKQAYEVSGKIREKSDIEKGLEGNRGYVLKEGKLTYAPKVKIEVTPAPPKAQ